MGAISNLGVAFLTALAVLSLIALSGELLYILCHRRRRRIAGDAEISCGVDTSPSLMLYLLCWKKNQTRIEPAVASPLATVAPPKLETTEEEEIDLAVWRAACLGPSRALYTIREEDEREAAVEEEEETPYSTPCASPAFFTPMASPVRAMEWTIGAGARPV